MSLLDPAFLDFSDRNAQIDKQSLLVKGWPKYSPYPTYSCLQGFRGKEIKSQNVHPEYGYPTKYNCTTWVSQVTRQSSKAADISLTCVLQKSGVR